MTVLTREMLRLCRSFARRKGQGQVLTQHELDLYEAASRFAKTLLSYQDMTSQAAVLKAQRELANELTQEKGATS